MRIGSRDTRAALRRGEIHLVVLAEDGSPRDQERLERIADEEGVPVRIIATRSELGSWVGFGAVSVLGLTDRRLAEAVRSRWDESRGETTGERPTTRAPEGQAEI